MAWLPTSLIGGPLGAQNISTITITWSPLARLGLDGELHRTTKFVAHQGQPTLASVPDEQWITPDGKVWGLARNELFGDETAGPAPRVGPDRSQVKRIYALQAELSFEGLRQFLLQCVLDNPKNDETSNGLSAGRSLKLSNASTFDQLVAALR